MSISNAVRNMGQWLYFVHMLQAIRLNIICNLLAPFKYNIALSPIPPLNWVESAFYNSASSVSSLHVVVLLEGCLGRSLFD